MNPEQWIATFEQLAEDVRRQKDSFEKERRFAKTIHADVSKMMEDPGEDFSARAKLLIQSLVYGWQKFRQPTGILNIASPSGLRYFVNYLVGYCVYTRCFHMITDAVTLASDQLDAWSRKTGTQKTLEETLVIVTEVDDVITDYRLTSGLVYALEKVDKRSKGVLLLSAMPLDTYPAITKGDTTYSFEALRIDAVLDVTFILENKDE